MKPQLKYFLAIIPLLIGASVPFAIKASNANQKQHFSRWETTLAHHKGERHHGGKFLDSLDLSEDQRTQVEAIHTENSEEMSAAWTQLKSEMETLKTLVSESASTDQLRQQHQKIKTIRSNLGTQRFEKMLKVYEILTPEQRKTFAEKIGKRHHGRRGRHHHKHSEDESLKQSMLLTF